MSENKILTQQESGSILTILRTRFENNQDRFPGLMWENVKLKIEQNPDKLWSLNEMEKTDGEPSLLEFDKKENQFIFCDFSKESPSKRRSLCYDTKALNSRKANKPSDSAENVAFTMGVEIMNENQYKKLQSLTECDTKTSSWLKTPENIRKQGGAIFGDFRYGQVFIYHNGAESYYAGRGFRGIIEI